MCILNTNNVYSTFSIITGSKISLNIDKIIGFRDMVILCLEICRLIQIIRISWTFWKIEYKGEISGKRRYLSTFTYLLGEVGRHILRCSGFVFKDHC